MDATSGDVNEQRGTCASVGAATYASEGMVAFLPGFPFLIKMHEKRGNSCMFLLKIAEKRGENRTTPRHRLDSRLSA